MADWRQAVLQNLGAPITKENVRFLTAWQRAEGTKARFNPLATTQPAPGASKFNTVGVRNYPSWDVGVDATVKTLTNGRYGRIVKLLRSGQADARQLATAVAQSPWGTGSGVLKVLGETPAPSSLGTTSPDPSPPAVELDTSAPDLTGAVLGNLSESLAQPRRRPDFSAQLASLTQAVATAPPVAPPPTTPKAPSMEPQESRGGLVAPLSTKMGKGSEFGISDPEGAPNAKGQRFHAGKDWFAPAGSAVRSPVSGRIVEVKASRGNSGQVFGGTVKVQDASGRVFVFRHVDPRGVKVGQAVRAGTPLATVSRWTGGSPHAHIEVWRTLRGGYRFENMLDPVSIFG